MIQGPQRLKEEVLTDFQRSMESYIDDTSKRYIDIKDKGLLVEINYKSFSNGLSNLDSDIL